MIDSALAVWRQRRTGQNYIRPAVIACSRSCWRFDTDSLERKARQQTTGDVCNYLPIQLPRSVSYLVQVWSRPLECRPEGRKILWTMRPPGVVIALKTVISYMLYIWCWKLINVDRPSQISWHLKQRTAVIVSANVMNLHAENLIKFSFRILSNSSNVWSELELASFQKHSWNANCHSPNGRTGRRATAAFDVLFCQATVVLGWANLFTVITYPRLSFESSSYTIIFVHPVSSEIFKLLIWHSFSSPSKDRQLPVLPIQLHATIDLLNDALDSSYSYWTLKVHSHYGTSTAKELSSWQLLTALARTITPTFHAADNVIYGNVVEILVLHEWSPVTSTVSTVASVVKASTFCQESHNYLIFRYPLCGLWLHHHLRFRSRYAHWSRRPWPTSVAPSCHSTFIKKTALTTSSSAA